ncbi:hypothetical protein PAPYR_8690 [Paratrimastix pyriformis]|uniref:Uncharacterized protein n=1 Tax=Paratrimastix pyriformis TaxID=342808 RepID=A0ABQ8UA21_9EUKA|nr:hypothetical protein PAPYR_8690 [Paratrimastix pyriformis]
MTARALNIGFEVFVSQPPFDRVLNSHFPRPAGSFANQQWMDPALSDFQFDPEEQQTPPLGTGASQSGAPSTLSVLAELQRASTSDVAAATTPPEPPAGTSSPSDKLPPQPSEEEMQAFMDAFTSEMEHVISLSPAELKERQEEMMKQMGDLNMADFEQQQQELFQSLKQMTPEQLRERQAEVGKLFEQNPEMHDFVQQVQGAVMSAMGRENIEPFVRPLVDKFPEWIEAHPGLGPSERDRYQGQLTTLRAILANYAAPDQSQEQCLEETVRLFAELQEQGKIPPDLLAQVIPAEYMDSYNALAQGNLPFLPPPTIPHDPSAPSTPPRPQPAAPASATQSPLSSPPAPLPPASTGAIEGNQCCIM